MAKKKRVVIHDQEQVVISDRECLTLLSENAIRLNFDEVTVDPEIALEEEVYVFNNVKTWEEFEKVRRGCLQLTAGMIVAQLSKVLPTAPVKFNLSLLTDEERKLKKSITAAMIDPCGADMASVVFDLGSGDEPK